MSKLQIPGTAAPNNLHFGEDVKATVIDSDLYNICDRLKEVDPRLFIVVLDSNEREGHSFAIMERCDDGWDRLVWRVKELDERVVRKAQYLASVPFEHRLAEAEKAEAQHQADTEDAAFEDLYERMGAPMRREFAKTGFTDPVNSTSYPIISRK